ncbi:unnamed protein product [Orchesella dallaii]|uniref:Uncharacterized protein n=1 Tax=Orchesella dallaii TaxID=48710 RepID=A0ABP1S5K0_9HEXA
MDKNGKQQPTQSSHLGWLKTAFSWLFRTGDHQQDEVYEEKEAADKEPRDVDVLSPIDPDASVGDPELPETSVSRDFLLKATTFNIFFRFRS